MRHLFSGTGEQYWKALGTTLLEKARVLLAVEVSEFDFAVAQHRRANAARAAGVQVKPLEVPSQERTLGDWHSYFLLGSVDCTDDRRQRRLDARAMLGIDHRAEHFEEAWVLHAGDDVLPAVGLE